MVLDFGLLHSTLFTSSNASGDGMNPDFQQKVIVEAGSGIVPIGGIVPWAKNLAGVPPLTNENKLFVECNGQVLDDSDSPLDGTTIPNLNGGNRFMRGNATSGGTGGAASSNHSHVTGGVGSGWVLVGSGSRYVTNSVNVGTVPPYYNIVWLMRVK